DEGGNRETLRGSDDDESLEGGFGTAQPAALLRAPPRLTKPAVFEGFPDDGVQIRVAAHVPRVAETLGGDIDGGEEALVGVLVYDDGEFTGHDSTRSPGAEVLGAEPFAGGVRQVAVHVTGVDRAHAVFGFVCEEGLALQVLTLGYQRGEPCVPQRHLVFGAALPVEAENDASALHFGMVGGQGRQPVGLVRLDVALGADPDQRAVEDGDRERHHLVSVEARPAEAFPDPLANARETRRERAHPLELDLVTGFFPVGVIDVLLAAGVVVSGGQDVAVVDRVDPHVGPRRWDNERLRPGAEFLVEQVSVLVDIGEALSPTNAAIPGLIVGGVAQAGDGSEFEGGGAFGHGEPLPRIPSIDTEASLAAATLRPWPIGRSPTCARSRWPSSPRHAPLPSVVLALSSLVPIWTGGRSCGTCWWTPG